MLYKWVAARPSSRSVLEVNNWVLESIHWLIKYIMRRAMCHLKSRACLTDLCCNNKTCCAKLLYATYNIIPDNYLFYKRGSCRNHSLWVVCFILINNHMCNKNEHTYLSSFTKLNVRSRCFTIYKVPLAHDVFSASRMQWYFTVIMTYTDTFSCFHSCHRDCYIRHTSGFLSCPGHCHICYNGWSRMLRNKQKNPSITWPFNRQIVQIEF